VATTGIDTAERIVAAFDVIDELTKERGLATSETVPPGASGLGAPPLRETVFFEPPHDSGHRPLTGWVNEPGPRP
jgi:hypothetical protein